MTREVDLPEFPLVVGACEGNEQHATNSKHPNNDNDNDDDDDDDDDNDRR